MKKYKILLLLNFLLLLMIFGIFNIYPYIAAAGAIASVIGGVFGSSAAKKARREREAKMRYSLGEVEKLPTYNVGATSYDKIMSDNTTNNLYAMTDIPEFENIDKLTTLDPRNTELLNKSIESYAERTDDRYYEDLEKDMTRAYEEGEQRTLDTSLRSIEKQANITGLQGGLSSLAQSKALSQAYQNRDNILTQMRINREDMKLQATQLLDRAINAKDERTFNLSKQILLELDFKNKWNQVENTIKRLNVEQFNLLKTKALAAEEAKIASRINIVSGAGSDIAKISQMQIQTQANMVSDIAKSLFSLTTSLDNINPAASSSKSPSNFEYNGNLNYIKNSLFNDDAN